MSQNTMIAVIAVCVTAFFSGCMVTQYKYKMAQLETTKSVAETKAEQGFKLKFGITKEKE